jgi:hypothetical protein
VLGGKSFALGTPAIPTVIGIIDVRCIEINSLALLALPGLRIIGLAFF